MLTAGTMVLSSEANISLCRVSQKEGRLAQLVERLPYKERVRSSSLLTPTIKEMMTLVIISFILSVLIARTFG